MAAITIGQVGAGFGQAVHVPAFRADPRARVVAIAAATPAKAQAVASALSIPSAHGSWRDLVADPDVGLVSIAVPPELQCEIASAAAANGKHLFLEKPVGTTLAEAEQLARIVEGSAVAASVDFLFTRVSAFEAAKRLIDTGAIGTIGSVSVTWRTRTRAHRLGLDSWKLRSSSGGGALNAFASHALHYIEWLAGPIRTIGATMAPSLERDDRLELRCELLDSGAVSVEIDTDFAGPPEHRVVIEGERGDVVLENLTRDTVDGFTFTSPAGSSGPAMGIGDGRIVPVSRLVAELLDAVEVGDHTSPLLGQGVRIQRLLDVARDAARRSRPVPVD
jgi:predicted dehydrogenase